jgi:hypothetical protein
LGKAKGKLVEATDSDLQPIELVLALLKGNVAQQQYSNGTTMDMIYEHLMNA